MKTLNKLSNGNIVTAKQFVVCPRCTRHHVPNETTRRALACGSEGDLTFASAADAFANLKAMIFPSRRPMFVLLIGIAFSVLLPTNMEFINRVSNTTMRKEKAIAKPSVRCWHDSVHKNNERIVLRE